MIHSTHFKTCSFLYGRRTTLLHSIVVFWFIFISKQQSMFSYDELIIYNCTPIPVNGKNFFVIQLMFWWITFNFFLKKQLLFHIML